MCNNVIIIADSIISFFQKWFFSVINGMDMLRVTPLPYSFLELWMITGIRITDWCHTYKVPHQRLLRKFQSYWVNDITLQLIRYILCNRKQINKERTIKQQPSFEDPVIKSSIPYKQSSKFHQTVAGKIILCKVHLTWHLHKEVNQGKTD